MLFFVITIVPVEGWGWSVDQGMVLCRSSVLLCCLSAGMVIESMAGKSGALHGLFHDATPFTFSEEQPAAAYFGDLLRAGNATCSSELGTEPRLSLIHI